MRPVVLILARAEKALRVCDNAGLDWAEFGPNKIFFIVPGALSYPAACSSTPLLFSVSWYLLTTMHHAARIVSTTLVIVRHRTDEHKGSEK